MEEKTRQTDILSEISDGKLYSGNDMVKIGCHDCAGCSECCRGMGDTILLDPYDIHRLMCGLGMTFQELMEGPVELHMEEGLVLPNLKMVGNEDEEGRCWFLNKEGRCSIHPHRPGLCRLFPLGRSYEPEGLRYFVLLHECPVKNKTKMKVSKWLDTPNLREYQEYLICWHEVSGQFRQEILSDPDAVEKNRQNSMLFLQYFYAKPYTRGNFFREFAERAAALKG